MNDIISEKVREMSSGIAQKKDSLIRDAVNKLIDPKAMTDEEILAGLSRQDFPNGATVFSWQGKQVIEILPTEVEMSDGKATGKFQYQILT